MSITDDLSFTVTIIHSLHTDTQTATELFLSLFVISTLMDGNSKFHGNNNSSLSITDDLFTNTITHSLLTNTQTPTETFFFHFPLFYHKFIEEKFRCCR